MRERLKENDILNLKSATSEKAFCISSYVGEGASCIVYDGYWFDDLDLLHNVRIKELYPISMCNDTRNNSFIEWNSEEDRDKSFEQFETTYKRQVTLQSTTGTSNSGSSIIDNIYSGNNTRYIIMDYDNGVTFAKKKYSSLQEILETILALAKFVKQFHDKGYLLMDIKPENFLVIEETNQLIKYLDFDSIIHKMRIFTGTNDISCSVNWAAPELIRGNIRRICEKTDYYSIGAVAYSKIFGSLITSKERSYGFTPNYKNNGFFDHINPRIYKLLTNFFRKTISNNDERRYQTINEMISDLSEMVRVSDVKSVSLTSVAADQKNYFVGRKNELRQIDEAFNNRKNVVILNGFGGVGKTELALSYYNNHNYYFHTKVWGKYLTGLKDLFSDNSVFNLRNVDNATFEEKIKLISEVVDKNTLIVIDNLDVLKDEYLNVLLSLNAKVLITTRARIDSIIDNSDTTEIIEVGPINKEELVELFKVYYSNKKYNCQDGEIEEIIDYLGRLTLMAPIVAKTMVVEGISPREMLSRLKAQKLANASKALVKHYKDNNLVENNAFMQASALYDLSSLSDDEKKVLFVISLMGEVHISRKYLAWFAGLDNKEFKVTYCIDFIEKLNKLSENCSINIVNKLIDKGYLFFDKEYDSVSCHNIIREISLYNTKYDIRSVYQLTEKLDFIIEKLYADECEECDYTFNGPSLKIDSSISKIPDCTRYDFQRLIINIFNNIDLDVENNLDYVLSRFLFIVFSCNGRNFENEINRLIPYCINNTRSKNIIEAIKLQFAFNRNGWFLQFRNGHENEDIFEGLTKLFSYADSYCDNDKCKYLNILFNIFYHSFNDYLGCMYEESFKVQELLIAKIREFSTLKDECDELYSDYMHGFNLFGIEYTPFDIDVIDIDDLCEKANKLEKKIAEKKQTKEDVVKNQIVYSENKDEEDTFSFSNCYEYFDEQISNRVFSTMKGIVHKDHFDRALDKICKDVENETYDLGREKQFTDECLKPAINDLEINTFIDSIYSGSTVLGPSAFNNQEYAFELLCRNKSLQFIEYCLKNFYRKKDVSKKLVLSRPAGLAYFYNYSLENVLLEIGAPVFYLELLRNSIQQINKTDLEPSVFEYEDINYSKLSSLCTNYANKYNYKKLYDAAKENENIVYNCGISFDYSKIDERFGFDYESELNKINYYHNAIKNSSIGNTNDLRDSIINDDCLSVFFKKHLLNALNSEDVNMFEYYVYPIANIKPRNQSVKYLIDKGNRKEFKGLEELVNLCELAFQYLLVSDECFEKRLCDIKEYISSHQTFNNVFDYMAFSVVYILINDFFSLVENGRLTANKLMLDFVSFVVDGWVYKQLNTFDYYLMDVIREKLKHILENVFEYKDYFDADEWILIVNHSKEIMDRFNYLDRTYIGDSHLISCLEEEDRLIYENKCNELIKEWENKDKTKEEYFGKFKEFFEEVFPNEDWKDY